MELLESELVENARDGDLAAFSRLVELHRTLALRVAYAIAGDEAEDVTQEAFIKAFQKLAGFQHGAPFRPWLMTIVANESRNRRRSAGRRSHLALRVSGRAEIADATPEEDAITNESRQQLLDAVSRLDDRDREIVALRYFAGLSEAETAKALGCAVGTVKSRLSRALQRLRNQFEEVVT